MAEINKSILVFDTPNCCDECFALDDNGDYPFCLITQEQMGYTFRTREQKMDKCPLKPVPKKHKELSIEEYEFGKLGLAFTQGWNSCINEILGGTDGNNNN